MRLTIDERPSGLSVAWSEQGRRSVQRELTKLHSSLFLHHEGGYWTVKDRDAGNFVVVYWQAANGHPLPLSFGIVDAAKEKQIRCKADEIRPHEMALRERDRRAKVQEKIAEGVEDVYRENRRFFTAGHAPGVTFPRTLRP